MVSQEATQPATQIVVDPWRLGQKDSDLNPKDLADICCILHPYSAPARRACCLIHQLTPEHTTANANTRIVRDSKTNEFDLDINAFSCDIALRLSATLKSPTTGGFYFGRNPQRCDIVIGKDASKRISNTHFWIYINEYGYLMLEDLSTNGTAVDGVLLRANLKEHGLEHQHVLTHGSLITLTMNLPEGEEDYRFVVRVPTRDHDSEEAYQENLLAYFSRIAHAKNERTLEVTKGKFPLDLFPIPDLHMPTRLVSKNICRKIREWKGGPKYNKISRIGKGAFATVYLITSKYDGVPYAAKELEKRRFMKNGVLDQKLDDEMKIMQKIKHPNIVQYVEHMSWETNLYIIMEYVPGGDLANYVNQHGLIPESEVKVIARQLLSALKYLHEGGITHRDVKPDNILVSTCNPLQVKLSDFGLSKMIESEETFLRTFCGTLLYCAPEVYCEYREFDENGQRTLRGSAIDNSPQRYGNAVDIWSLAGVLFFSLCCRPPYPVEKAESYLDLLTRIMSQPLDIRPLQYVNVSENGIHFIRQMLNIRPKNRATIQNLEMSPWLLCDDKTDSLTGYNTSLQYNESFPRLEESASQLSIHDHKDTKLESKISADNTNNDPKEIQQMEVPCSFDSSQSFSWLLDSYELSTSPINRRKSNHLFGELTGICLGSSSAIPFEKINLPLSCRENYTNISHDLRFASGSSSLFGAESLVGNLNVHSPSLLDTENSDQTNMRSLRSTTISLRRPREEDPNTALLEPKRMRRSASQSYLPGSSNEVLSHIPRIPPKNHANSISNSRCVKEYFQGPKRIFSAGERSSISTLKQSIISPEIEAKIQTNYDSPNDEFQQSMSRDNHRVSKTSVNENLYTKCDTAISTQLTLGVKSADAEFLMSPTDAHNFSNVRICQPKATLARLIATLDSCIPTIKMSVTDFITSWGRGSKATIRYHDVTESRIPKYAFKIFLYKQNYFGNIEDFNSCQASWNDACQDMSFYISTKASVGIWINDINLPSHDRQNPNTESKYWGRINHGDLITVWRHDSKPTQIFTRFRFECYWGQSKNARKPGDQFKLIQDRLYLKDLESSCKKLEKSESSSAHSCKTDQLKG